VYFEHKDSWGHRITGGKPYISENLPFEKFKISDDSLEEIKLIIKHIEEKEKPNE